MNLERRLYNALAYLVTIVRQVRHDLANPTMTKYNLEDLDTALEKSETLLLQAVLATK